MNYCIVYNYDSLDITEGNRVTFSILGEFLKIL